MTKTQVIKLLEEHRNERGITHWKKENSNLKSFGLGLTQQRKIAKQIGRDHKLAQQLWKSSIYDAKIIALLIDDPKLITIEQAEKQVEELGEGLFTHVFASCDATLAKTPFAFELANEWTNSKSDIRRRCGYKLLYELSKKNTKGMDEVYLLNCINHIQTSIHNEEMWVREAMAQAMIGIGKRSQKLNRAAIRAAKAIGQIDVDYGDDNSCQPPDILKHLTSEYVRQKFAKSG